jgi:hypothetical protein
MLLLLGVAAYAPAQADSDRVRQPTFPQARERVSDAQGCVAPTDIMRRKHGEFLLQQRDKTVREGIRTKRFSLVGCIECHASTDEKGKPIPINAPGQFCQACHTYTSVSIDCFQCHATTPAETASARSPPQPQAVDEAGAAQILAALSGWTAEDLIAANACAIGKIP